MGDPRTVIHCNSRLAHQVELAECLRAGMGGEISYSADTEADLHVVMGPWFAFKRWQYANTLYIDRAYWGDPDCVSIHCLRAGEKIRTTNNPHRDHPAVKPWKTGRKTVVLCDYGMDGSKLAQQYGADIRKHPAEGEKQPLCEILEQYDIAVGCRTTALVDAAIAGLVVHTNDKHSPVRSIQGQQCDRKQWLNDLAAHNWSKTEISRGEMWATIQNQ